MGLLEGKKGLVLNIANDRSIAWHIANNAIKHGARCGFGFLPMDNIEKSKRRVLRAMEEGGFPNEWLYPCDVSKDSDIEAFFAAARIAVPGSLIGALVAEWLSTGKGIGGVILNAIGAFAYNQVWTSIAVLTGVSLLIYTAVGVLESLVLSSAGFTGVP